MKKVIRERGREGEFKCPDLGRKRQLREADRNSNKPTKMQETTRQQDKKRRIETQGDEQRQRISISYLPEPQFLVFHSFRAEFSGMAGSVAAVFLLCTDSRRDSQRKKKKFRSMRKQTVWWNEIAKKNLQIL